MPIDRQVVSPFQRTDHHDFAEASRLGVANLMLALRALHAPGLAGVVKGGTFTAGVGRFLDLAPTVAFDSAGNLLLIESTTSVGEFQANGGPHSRIDLVSIGYAEDPVAVENRAFINPADNSTFTANVPTKFRARAAVTVTTGTPSATPAAPSTPPGHVPLAHVTIAPGTAQLTAGHISPVSASLVRPVRLLTQAPTASTLPWESDRLAALATPPGSASIIFAQVAMRLLAPAVYTFSLLDKTASTTIASTPYASTASPQQSPLQLITTLVSGPTATVRDLAMRIAPSQATGGASYELANISICAVTL